MECSNCGVSESSVERLFDVISGEGIVKLCQECLSSDSVPLKRAGGLEPGQEKKQTTYERLSAMAGIKDPEIHKQNIFGSDKKETLKKQEVTLRDLVDKKFDRFVKDEVKKRDDLIDNFHWVIMRARRHKKWSVSQLAREIQEPERVIKMAEQGILPEGYDVVIKLETILGVNLLKPGVVETLQRQKNLGFDKITTKTLTIQDLQAMRDNDPGMDLGVEKGLMPNGKKKPYWRKALSRIMGKRQEEENANIVVTEVPTTKEAREAEANVPGPSVDDLKEEMQKEVEKEEQLDEDNTQEVEYDETSLQMVTRFSGEIEDDSESIDTGVEKIEEPSSVEEEVREAAEKPKKEMTQEEIDDLIFGRK